MAQTPNVGPNANARATGFNAFAAGDKVYGAGRSSPNLGPTSNLEGYRQRNLQIEARKAAAQRRLDKGQLAKTPLSSPPGSGPIGV
jgi:hypothetical protein